MWITAILLLGLACFAGVLLVGAPYLPTLAPQLKAALELTDLKQGDTLLELGFGDGRVLVAAAQQGFNVVGYELNPLLVIVAWLRTRRYRNQITIIWGDYWRKPWPAASAIFVFLLPKYMSKLDTKIAQYKHTPVKLVSFAFKIPDKQIVQEKQGVYLYKYL
jgi:16S rRNA A1518/A1519 N6-dimethyltransferase RsmA/KsgA/DIM1 with predicted DNA glycosylase/AP lyase activity